MNSPEAVKARLAKYLIPVMIIAIVTSPNPGWEAVGLVSLFTILTGGMATGLLLVARGRARWTRRTLGQQWTRAGVIFAAVGLLHALIGAGWISMWI